MFWLHTPIYDKQMTIRTTTIALITTTICLPTSSTATISRVCDHASWVPRCYQHLDPVLQPGKLPKPTINSHIQTLIVSQTLHHRSHHLPRRFVGRTVEADNAHHAFKKKFSASTASTSMRVNINVDRFIIQLINHSDVH